MGNVGSKTSWHNQYRDSAWVFFGGMPFELTEGDIIIQMKTRYGEIVNINLVRDKKTGKSKGFGFLCYENQLSTDLAVDNFNGTKILGRIIKVDHVANYKPPKDSDEADEVTKFLREEGCSSQIVSSLSEKVEREKSELAKNVKTEPPSVRRDDRREDRSQRDHSRDRCRDERTTGKYRDHDYKERDRRRDDRLDREDRYNRNSHHKKDKHRSRSKSRSKSPKGHHKKHKNYRERS